DGRVTFVARSAPGERVLARVIEVQRSFARAELVEIRSPSEAWVEAPCDLFVAGTCGGCQWLHVARDVQIASKQALVESALRRAVARGLAVHPVAAPTPALGWRRRARLHWTSPDETGPAILGYYAPGSHAVTP